MSEFAWLDDAPAPLVINASNAPPATSIVIRPVKPSLTGEQETYALVLRSVGWSIDKAREQIIKDYSAMISLKQIDEWWEDDYFCTVIETWRRKTLAKKGITPSQTLLDTRQCVNYAMAKQPVLYKGEPTGYYERDIGAALKGLELLGKAQKVWNDTEKVNVHVEVELIDWAGPKPVGEIIDGEGG